jgi:hypothetical protein
MKMTPTTAGRDGRVGSCLGGAEDRALSGEGDRGSWLVLERDLSRSARVDDQPDV